MGRGVPNLVVSGFFKIVLFRVPYKHLAFAKVDPTACPIVQMCMDGWMNGWILQGGVRPPTSGPVEGSVQAGVVFTFDIELCLVQLCEEGSTFLNSSLHIYR